MYKNYIRNLAPLASGIGTHKRYYSFWILLDVVCFIDIRMDKGIVITPWLF